MPPLNPNVILSHTSSAPVARSTVRWLLLASILFTPWIASRAQSPVVEQRISLARGWNLISFQVSGPRTGGGFSFEDLTNSLISIASDQRSELPSQIWAFQAPNDFLGRVPQIPDFPDNAVAQTYLPGRGYWLSNATPSTLVLRGPAWVGIVDISANQWDLVGFPGPAAAEGESFDLTSVFGAQLSDLEELWTWEPALNRFVGYEPGARPPIVELQAVQPGRGYWVRMRRPFRAVPIPALFLPPDIDLSPLVDRTDVPGSTENFDRAFPNGIEDKPFDLDGDGFLDSPTSQRTLRFDPGVSSQTISLMNRGSGLFAWSVSNSIPWLKVSPMTGVVGTETDTLTLTVDRSSMLPGTEINASGLVMYAGATNWTIANILVTPTSQGDYRGAASITRVNGKEIPLGKVDLHLSLFDDTPAGNEPAGKFFHAVINRDQALLFPQDAFLRGVFYSGLDFTLTTTFTMPAGDRNLPPYENFKGGTSNPAPNQDIAFRDIDVNGDGKLDNLNPFPHPIGRQITLIGRRVDDGFLKGTYVEAVKDAIQGQSIYLEGTFELSRQQFQPTLRTAYIGRSDSAPASIGGSVGYAYTNTIQVPNSINISEALVRIHVNHPSATNLTYFLVSPIGNNFELVATNDVWRARGLGGNQGLGNWSLVVVWDGTDSQRGRFLDWELNLIGFNFRGASGRIFRANTNSPLTGANLTLIGGNVPALFTNSPSSYVINELTEDSYVLRADFPGLQSAQVSFTLANASLVLPPLVLQPYTNVGPELRAEPFVGAAPLFSRQVLRVSESFTSTSLGSNLVAEWSLGDGRRITNFGASAFSAVENTYLKGGYYTNIVRLRGSRATYLLTNSVHAHSMGPNPATVALALSPTFVAPISLNGSIAGGMSAAPPGTIAVVARRSVANWIIQPNGITNRVVGTSGIVDQESFRDMAAFDFRRGSASLAASDKAPDQEFLYIQNTIRMRPGVPPIVLGSLVSNEYPANIGFDLYTNVPPRRFRMETTLGGSVFGPFEYPNRPWANENPRVGDLILQTGRIEP